MLNAIEIENDKKNGFVLKCLHSSASDPPLDIENS